MERLIGTLRRDCLDHVIVLNERHLRRILARYLGYYHRWRTHLSLGMDAPSPRAVHLPDRGRVVEFPELSGLHNHCERLAEWASRGRRWSIGLWRTTASSAWNGPRSGLAQHVFTSRKTRPLAAWLAASARRFWPDLRRQRVRRVVICRHRAGGDHPRGWHEQRVSESELASWIFGVFFINGWISIVFCWLYRQPLAFFWTIPGTVLVGPALTHLSFAEVIGACHATGLLMLALGASGWVRRAMQAVPMPIVMGMVAGVFLRFGLDLVRALHADIAIAGPMVGTYLLLSALPALGRRMPPPIGALFVGAAATALPRRYHRSGRHRTGAARVARASMVAGCDDRTRGAARDHRAGGAERPGFRSAEGGRE